MLMAHFIRIHDEPVFFILELPSKQKDEIEVRPGVVASLHKDIYYIDGCTTEEALAILNRIGKLVINDGLCAFGFRGHESKDEIMFGKYNVTTIYSGDLSKFDGFFEKHEISKSDNLITAWDTFSTEHPGQCEKVVTGGQEYLFNPKATC